jgi:AraC-like DNA-binding protein
MRTQHGLAALEADPEVCGPMRTTLRERAKAYIGRHIREADLSVDKIAAALGCSKRYLHLVFNAGEETVSEYVWRQRLEGCRAELSDPAFRLTLTEIAYAWGFNSSAHFSRAFKERYGVPPSAHRLQGWIGGQLAAPPFACASPAGEGPAALLMTRNSRRQQQWGQA